MEYTVNGIETTDTIGDEYLNQKAQETYLIVSVTVKNNGDDALSVLDSFFKLKKGDKTYNTDSTAIMYLGDESIFAKEINPDASLKGKIVFDVTKATIDDKNLQLQVQTGAWGHGKGADQSALDRYRLRQKELSHMRRFFFSPLVVWLAFFYGIRYD